MLSRTPMQLLALDFETWGRLPEYALQPHRLRTGDAWVTSYAYAAEKDGTIKVGGRRQPTLTEVKDLLLACARSDIYIVCWNTPFDVAWLLAMGLREEVYACKWLDGMLLYRHMTSKPNYLPGAIKSYNLKLAVETFLPEYAGYAKEVTFDPQTTEEWDDLVRYNKLDARLTLMLAQKFLAEMPKDVKRAALVEAECLPMVAEANLEGIVANLDNAAELSKKLADTTDYALVTLMLTAGGAVSLEVLSSPAQLGDLLYKEWGLPVTRYTPTGNFSTDKDALAELARTDERAKLIHQWREAANNRTKFAEAVLDSARYNGETDPFEQRGIIRPSARVYATYTGRMTYSSKQGKGKSERPVGVALHQWKRGEEYRRSITVPEGCTLMEFDFAGQEFRWMAVESGDPTMLRLCQPGEDAHGFMGAKISSQEYRALVAAVKAGDPTAETQRRLGKVANLSLQYRTSAKRLQGVAFTQYGLDLTMPFCASIHATYLTTYQRVRPYWDRQIYRARTEGYVQTIAGRRVWLGKGIDWPQGRGDAWSYESTAINFPIQGVGADQKYLALKVLKDYLPSVGGRFYFELHDGLFIIVPDGQAEKAGREIKHLLSNLPYKEAWDWEPPIPFPVDGKMGKSWGDLKGF